jgi:hypothetical protein
VAIAFELRLREELIGSRLVWRTIHCVRSHLWQQWAGQRVATLLQTWHIKSGDHFGASARIANARAAGLVNVRFSVKTRSRFTFSGLGQALRSVRSGSSLLAQPQDSPGLETIRFRRKDNAIVPNSDGY